MATPAGSFPAGGVPSLREFGTIPAYVDSSVVTIKSWPIREDGQTMVSLVYFDLASSTTTLPRGGVWFGVGKAARDGAGAPILIGSTLSKAENLTSETVNFDVIGNELVLTFEAKILGAPDLPYTIRYFVERQANP